jgi:hypothetical protein
MSAAFLAALAALPEDAPEPAWWGAFRLRITVGEVHGTPAGAVAPEDPAAFCEHVRLRAEYHGGDDSWAGRHDEWGLHAWTDPEPELDTWPRFRAAAEEEVRHVPQAGEGEQLEAHIRALFALPYPRAVVLRHACGWGAVDAVRAQCEWQRQRLLGMEAARAALRASREDNRLAPPPPGPPVGYERDPSGTCAANAAALTAAIRDYCLRSPDRDESLMQDWARADFHGALVELVAGAATPEDWGALRVAARTAAALKDM